MESFSRSKKKEILKTIGVAGQRGMGKDVLADYLASRLAVKREDGECSFTRTAFAEPIKDILGECFGVSREFIERWKVISEIPHGFHVPVREALTRIGATFRSIYRDVWIDRILGGQYGAYRIISDVRFINEAEAIKEYGNSVNVLLYRPHHLNMDESESETQLRDLLSWLGEYGEEGEISNLACCRSADASNSKIASLLEQSRLFDVFLINSGTIHDLYRKADDILIPYITDRFSVSVLPT